MKANSNEIYERLVVGVREYAIYMLDLRGRVVNWNAGAERAKGYTAAEIVGKNFSRFYTVEDRRNGAPARALRTALTDGKFEAEGWRVRKDGSRFWAHVVIDIIRDDDGEPIGFAKITRDCTERKLAMAAIHAGDRRFRLLVQCITDYAIYMLSPEGVVTNWNAGAERAKGYSSDEVIGRHFSLFYTGEDQARGEPAQALRIAGVNGRFEGQGWRVRKDGGRFWASVVIDPVHDEAGALIGFAKITRDMTEQKNAEERVLTMLEQKEALTRTLDEAARVAEAASAAKSEFLATMSHEIRTPLNGVLGMAQAMAAGELDGVQRERLKVIVESGENLLSILNNILDLSKVEAGKIDLEAIPFDLKALMEHVHASFKGAAAEKDIFLDLKFDPDCFTIFRGDPVRVRQIVSNLIGNAVKFTSQGGVSISVASAFEGVRIAVTDSGIGLSADQSANLFQKFVQADTSTTRKFGGTGLGLSIARELAALMGGSITLESSPGKGSTFTVKLKLERCARVEAQEDGVAPAQDLSVLRVLAADDNPTNRLVLATLLEQVGVTLVFAENGALAVEAWKAADFDLILMDIQMPYMDGTIASAMIRRLEIETGRSRTPIIALTADAMTHQLGAYQAAGMDDVVTKPINAKALFEAMQSALSSHAH
ncbi:MAG: PAS domain S-box protein [Caulobacteraceae bacterium]